MGAASRQREAEERERINAARFADMPGPDDPLDAPDPEFDRLLIWWIELNRKNGTTYVVTPDGVFKR